MVVHDAQRRSVVYYLNPVLLVRNVWTHRNLIGQLTTREVRARYKGSWLGLLWMVLNPLLLLAVYTFVFSIVFQAKWGITERSSRAEFALTLFCGLIVFTIFSECATQAPALMLSHANYVKKVRFPLEILPVALLGTSLFSGAISFAILLAAVAIFSTISISIVCLPLVLLPLVMLSLGVSWFLASLGVYLRDINHVVGILVTIFFFMTPIFYPATLVPEKYAWVMRANPFASVVENARRVMLWGLWPEWLWLLPATVFSFVVAQLGYAWFMKTKRGFSDVL